MTIIDLIQQEVNKLALKEYKMDACPPRYTVSIFKGSIILTVEHAGQAFSDQIFPEGDMTYGISDLHELIINLYNRTM